MYAHRTPQPPLPGVSTLEGEWRRYAEQDRIVCVVFVEGGGGPRRPRKEDLKQCLLLPAIGLHERYVLLSTSVFTAMLAP